MTSIDEQLDDEPEEEIESIVKTKPTVETIGEKKFTPVNFYSSCIEKISKYLDLNLVKQSKISFSTKDKQTGLICTISKEHKQGKHQKYWFAFHPHQKDYLDEFNNAFVGYGCGDASQTFLFQ